VIKIKKAVVSVLFVESSLNQFGDAFLSRLGIDSRRKQADGSYITVAAGEDVDFDPALVTRGSNPPGIDIDALTGLRNILNLDHTIYRYMGSEN